MPSIPKSRVDYDVFGFFTDKVDVPVTERSHVHPEIEINLLEKGRFSYLFGGTLRKLEIGQFCAFWAAIPHQAIPAHKGVILHVLTLPLPWFLQWRLPAAFSKELLRGGLMLESDNAQAGWDFSQFQRWHKDLKKKSEEGGKIAALEVEARLRRLAQSWAIHKKSGAKLGLGLSGQGEFDKVEKMASFMAENYAKPLRLEEIAQVASLHPNYATAFFKKHCGLGIVDYLTQHRIWHAQRLLATTDAKVLDLALESGFGSASRFYEAFQKICGLSPKQYRRNMGQGRSKP
jgi:AraC-like DNA-binding protein